MENLSSKGKGAWSTVCNQSADFYETVDPTGCRELVDLGLMEEVKQDRGRVAFKLTKCGMLVKDYERLTARLFNGEGLMGHDAADAIRHIMVRLGPPV